MFWKLLLLSSVILCCCLAFFGQSGFPYEAEWKLIDSLMNKKNLPKSALVEVNKLRAAEKMEKNEAQWLKAILCRDQMQESEDKKISHGVRLQVELK
jgi:hypothetical protein